MPPPRASLKAKPRFRPLGFTLAELLISLAILGVIATFTIPKILTTQQNSQYTAQAKEAMAMVSEAYQKAQSDGIATSSMTPIALKPYMNYVSNYTGLIDRYPTNLSMDCSSSYSCIKLHNGGCYFLIGKVLVVQVLLPPLILCMTRMVYTAVAHQETVRA